MAKANAERGEHELVLAGTRYCLRPSYAAIKALEAETGQSALTLFRLANVGGLTLEQLGIVGAELIRAGADEKDTLTRAIDAERVGELIFESEGPNGVGGLPYAHARIGLCLQAAVTGGVTASGEAKAAPADPKTKDAGAASPE